MRNVFYFSKKVRLFSQNDVLFLFYFLINPAGTTEIVQLQTYVLLLIMSWFLHSESTVID